MREDLPEPKCWLLLSTWSLLLRPMSSAHMILVQVARKLFEEGDLTIWAELHVHSLILRVGVNKLQRSFQWARIIAWQAWGVRVIIQHFWMHSNLNLYLGLWFWCQRRPPVTLVVATTEPRSDVAVHENSPTASAPKLEAIWNSSIEARWKIENWFTTKINLRCYQKVGNYKGIL